MSFIKQVISVDKFNSLSKGSKGVFYIVYEPAGGFNSLVRGYVWDGNRFIPIVDPNFVIHCPYNKEGYDFITIKDALDFLLTRDLQVSLIVTPYQTYGAYPIDVNFSWVTSKPVVDIESINLKRIMGGSETVIATNLVQYTVNTTGQRSIQQILTGDAVYEITVIDKSGNVATTSVEVKYMSSNVQILEFNVLPEYWHERGDSNESELTLSWVLSIGKEHLNNIYFQEKTYSSDDYSEPVSLMDYTFSDGSGSFTLTQELTENVVFKLSAVSVFSPEIIIDETTIVFIPYVPISIDIPLSINPSSSSGIQTNYTFTSTFNRVFNINNGGYLRIFQVDSMDNKMLDETNVFGGGYVDINVLNSKYLLKQMQLTILETTYFKLEALEIDEYMNTSGDASYDSVSFNVDLEFTALSISPVKDYINNNGYQSGYLFTAIFNNSLIDNFISLVELSVGNVDYEISEYNINENELSFTFIEQFIEDSTIEFLLKVIYSNVELSRTIELTMYPKPDITDSTFIHTGEAGKFNVGGTLTRELKDVVTVKFANKNYSPSSVIDGTELLITDILNNFSFVTGQNTQTLLITETLNGGRGTYQLSKSISFTLYNITFVVRYNGSPIKGVSVNINNNTLKTNVSGQAVASALSNGLYPYLISHTGYNTIQDNVQISNANQTINIDLTEVEPDHYVYFGRLTIGETYGDVTIIQDAGISVLTALQQPSVVTGESFIGTDVIDPITIQYPVYPSSLVGYMFLASECPDYIGYKMNMFFAPLEGMWIHGLEYNVTINNKVYYLYIAKFRVEGENDPSPEMTFSSVEI